MSEKELSRYSLVEQVVEKTMSQAKAAKLLGISARHFRRLLKAYRTEGAKGLISKKRGKVSNRKLPEALKTRTLNLIEGKYKDFGPSFANEKLHKEEKISISVETLRQWMIEAGLWKGKQKKKLRLHQSRARRSCVGELIQVDGSPHDWFEGRRKPCSLLAFIDDATSRIMHLKFVESETTIAYFDSIKEYIQKHGRPECLYTDRLSVFRVNSNKEGYKGKGITQVGRALRELDIELICANSPQEKGRVERLFHTLQNRLIKELRLRKLSVIEEANQYLSEYIEGHNRRFSVEPMEQKDAHRNLLEEHSLRDILCYKSERTLSKNLEFSYGTRILHK